MSNLKEVANLAWNQAFPKGSTESPITLVEFIRSAISIFAYQTLLMCWKQRSDDGYFDVPSYLLTTVSLPVVNNVMDISVIQYFKSLPNDVWLQNIGGIDCECKYVKSDINLSQLLCDDNSLDDASKTYFILGKSIQFPKGVNASPLSLTYANIGETVDDNIECDEAIASLIRKELNEMYLGRVPKEDVTINQNPNDPNG